MKRWLVFSTIEDMGYLLFGLTLLGATVHALTKGLLFASVCVIEAGGVLTLVGRHPGEINSKLVPRWQMITTDQNPPSTRERSLFAFGLLFKDWLFFLGFGVLSLITGFALPSLELYEAMSQALTKRIINSNWYVVTLVLAVVINFAIVRTTLLSKYAVRRQATRATFVFFPVLVLLTFLGFWVRVNLHYQVSSSGPIPQFLPAAIAVSLTLSAFSVIYGLAAEPYVKVDYSTFQTWITKLFNHLEQTRHQGSTEAEFTKDDLEKVRGYLRRALESLHENIAYEPRDYEKFLEDDLLTPLDHLKEFLDKPDVSSAPGLVSRLREERTMIQPEWIAEAQYDLSFKELTQIFGRR